MEKSTTTIAAIATAPGEGAIAIVRMSGPEALAIASQLFSKKLMRSHTAYFGRILSASGQIIDQALAIAMMAPNSYTGEDIVELHCHGGKHITESVLQACLDLGAKPASPGEFTFRAFMNGKIDLAQAEAVQAMIAAKSSAAALQASHQLEGAVSKKVLHLQKELFDVAAILEAWVDFPEEGIAFGTLEDIAAKLERVKEEIAAFAATFHDGRILQEGLLVCLVGAPNVGKSALMNALLKKERAIVTPIAGTTRDTIEEPFRLGDLTLRLLDTAGLRETDETVEQEGIKRSQKAINEADIILHILDATRPLEPVEEQLLQKLDKTKTLAIWNKVDMAPLGFSAPLAISATEGLGLEELKEALLQHIWKGSLPAKDEILITSLRHKEALLEAAGYCAKVIDGLREGLSPEFLTSDLKEALKEMSKIIGKDITEEILSAIFSKFCIGK